MMQFALLAAQRLEEGLPVRRGKGLDRGLQRGFSSGSGQSGGVGFKPLKGIILSVMMGFYYYRPLTR